MAVGEVIAIFGIAVPVIAMIFGFIIKSKNDEIKLLEAKIDGQAAIISELRLQNMKLEVSGVLVNKFFSQLPQVTNEVRRENQT